MIFPGITLHEKDWLGERPQAPRPPSVLLIICGAWVIPIQGAQRAPAGAEPLNIPCNHHSGLCCFNFPGAATPVGSPQLSYQWLPPLSSSGTAPCQGTVGPSALSVHPTPCRHCNLETGQFIPLPAG